MYNYTCLYCQNQFAVYYKQRKYCSKKCTREAKKDKNKPNAKCLYCKIPFRSYANKSCSEKCRDLYQSSYEFLKNTFEKHVIKKEDGCWDWNGGKSLSGYPFLSFRGKKLRANRASWMIHNGSIPKGYFVCHHCDVKICTRINHLFLGTPKDNTQDFIKKGLKKVKIGEKNPNTKRKQEIVKQIKIMISEGKKDKEIAKLFNEDRRWITMVRHGKTWKYLTID